MQYLKRMEPRRGGERGVGSGGAGRRPRGEPLSWVSRWFSGW